MSATINNPTPTPAPKQLTAHCIVVGHDCDKEAPAATLRSQTELFDAVTVVANCQTPALSAALASVTSDLVFFLLTGDTWTHDFVARIRAVFQAHPQADVVTCESIQQAADERSNHTTTDATDFGYNAVATYANLEFVAQPLSCLSLRRRIIQRILPLVDDPDWLDQPQVPLAIAASLASARRYHLAEQLVASPLAAHSRNQSAFAQRMKVLRLVGKIANQLGLNPDFVKQFLVMEYSSCRKDPQTITKYCRLLQAYHPDTRSRRQILLSMYRNMKEHLRGDGSASGYFRRWWLKQKLLWTGKLAI